MKTLSITATALFLAVSITSPALAKPGDLYVNADGSCDKGDSKPKGSYWCVESIKIAGATGTGPARAVAGPKPGRIYPAPGQVTKRPDLSKQKGQ